MKFTCDREALASQLEIVIKNVPSRPSHAILECVCISVDADTGHVRFMTYDLNTAIVASLEADSSELESGALAVPAKLLNDIVSKLVPGAVVVTSEDLIFNIESLSGSYQIRSFAPDEYPEIPERSGTPISLDSERLREALHGVLYAASTDETRQILSGINVTLKPYRVEFASTDGHRLAAIGSQGEIDLDEPEVEITLPAKAMKQLEWVLKDSQTVTFYYDLNLVSLGIDSDRVSISIRPLCGQYPNYRQLIPREFKTEISTARKPLVKALELLSVLATGVRVPVVKFEIDVIAQQIIVSAEREGNNGREIFDATATGDDLILFFNVAYFLDTLKAIPDDEVQIHLNTPISPVVLHPATDPEKVHLLMPLQQKGL